jgi:hypothetical protein
VAGGLVDHGHAELLVLGKRLDRLDAGGRRVAVLAAHDAGLREDQHVESRRVRLRTGTGAGAGARTGAGARSGARHGDAPAGDAARGLALRLDAGRDVVAPGGQVASELGAHLGALGAAGAQRAQLARADPGALAVARLVQPDDHLRAHRALGGVAHLHGEPERRAGVGRPGRIAHVRERRGLRLLLRRGGCCRRHERRHGERRQYQDPTHAWVDVRDRTHRDCPSSFECSKSSRDARRRHGSPEPSLPSALQDDYLTTASPVKQ